MFVLTFVISCFFYIQVLGVRIKHSYIIRKKAKSIAKMKVKKKITRKYNSKIKYTKRYYTTLIN